MKVTPNWLSFVLTDSSYRVVLQTTVGEQAEHSSSTQHLQVKIPGAGVGASERNRRSNSELEQALAGGTVNPLL